MKKKKQKYYLLLYLPKQTNENWHSSTHVEIRIDRDMVLQWLWYLVQRAVGLKFRALE